MMNFGVLLGVSDGARHVSTADCDRNAISLLKIIVFPLKIIVFRGVFYILSAFSIESSETKDGFILRYLSSLQPQT